MNKVEKKSLIKSLLSDILTKKQRKEFADLEPIDIEIRKQWNESGNRLVDVEIKEQIWKKVKNRCECKKKNQVPVELRWYFAAASLALLLRSLPNKARCTLCRIVLKYGWSPEVLLNTQNHSIKIEKYGSAAIHYLKSINIQEVLSKFISIKHS